MLLICEGKHTEPNFFEAMIEWLKEEERIHFGVRILPKPTITPKDDELDLNRGVAPRKKRTPKNDTPEQQELENKSPFPGAPPLNWVEAGIEQLHTYDEVWTIFDKDEHPKTKEAIRKAKKTKVNGKKVKVAFSSRCFEYYLLLHFEQIYKAFEKAECNGKRYSNDGQSSKTVSYHCMTSRAVEGKACHGDKCINGYARLKEYWTESKRSDSTFPLVKDKLWTGVCNAHAIRWKSNLLLPDTTFYTRNPYVDTDKLICRLMGYKTIEHKESHLTNSGRDYYRIERKENLITFTLESDTTMIIPAESIRVYNNRTGVSREAGIRLILSTQQPEQTLDLHIIIAKDDYCIITLIPEEKCLDVE